uniref:Uncharacterized protein n=1 Tax=Phocoena sinus TaxID=42100 RepID=A0A8C9BTF2_PHOSS
MSPYQSHKYQENYRKWVVGLFSKVMTEHLPTTFHHILKLPRTLVLLLAGAPCPIPGLWLLVAPASGWLSLRGRWWAWWEHYLLRRPPCGMSSCSCFTYVWLWSTVVRG